MRRSYVSPLRERRAEQTRGEILDALTRLLGDHAADEVTTKKIAVEAGVAERTVYRHFPDRAALLEGLSDRLTMLGGRAPDEPASIDDFKTFAVALMHELEAHAVEARAEALFNADPRRFSQSTRDHTRRMHEVVIASLPELNEHQALLVSGVVRCLLSAQAWLRMREELGIPGDESGPVVAWVVDAIVEQVRRGHLPPTPTLPSSTQA